MKNKHHENLRKRARLAHRSNKWNSGSGRVFATHVFEPERALTWWDDVSFILNNRRVMVWWVHPRMKYSDAINDAAWKAAGEAPEHDDFLINSETLYKPAGRARKRIYGYRSAPTPADRSAYYDQLREIDRQLQRDGIDHTVTTAMSVTQLNWCTGVDLCVPLEIRCQADAVALAALVRRLLTHKTTLAAEFPSYAYGRPEWLAETKAREEDEERRHTESKQLPY